MVELGGRDDGGCSPTSTAPTGEGRSQLQVIRLKRKRAIQAPSSLYVQEGGRDDVDLASLSLEDSDRKRPRTYRKMATMTAEELGSASHMYLESLFAVSGVEEPGKIEKTAEDTELYHASFDVVTKKRGRTAFEDAEMLPDPLRALGKVCDVECSERSQDAEKEDDYVYDLYIARDDTTDVGEHQPYFYIYDDDFYAPEEDMDHEDSFDDTEDSNAEGYYGNDYPDEGWSSEPSEGYSEDYYY
eukprot:jgi/Picre1/28440/NNA_003844.t1